MNQDNALVKAPTQDLIPEVRNMESLAKHLLESKLFPNAHNLAGVITIVEYGRELGIPPVAALQTMCVINGKLAMEAKAMLAVASKNAGVTWKIDKLNDTECVMTFMRPNAPPIVSSFTELEAKEAGLLTKSNWKLYKQDMLFARCASRGIRRIAPDAVLGLYSTEEMRDVEEINRMGIAVPEDKEIIETKPPITLPAPTEVGASEFDAEPEPAPIEIPEAEPGEPTFQEELEDVDLTDDAIMNSYIAQIKYAVERSGIDEKKWKEWLIGQGKKMNRQFVGRIGRAIRYHKGKPEDVKYLQSVIDRAISLYVKEN